MVVSKYMRDVMAYHSGVDQEAPTEVSVVANFGKPQWIHLRARKPLLYHKVPENHFPHLGQRHVESRIPTTRNSAIQIHARTKLGMKVPKSLLMSMVNRKTIGTYPSQMNQNQFLTRL